MVAVVHFAAIIASIYPCQTSQSEQGKIIIVQKLKAEVSKNIRLANVSICQTAKLQKKNILKVVHFVAIIASIYPCQRSQSEPGKINIVQK